MWQPNDETLFWAMDGHGVVSALEWSGLVSWYVYKWVNHSICTSSSDESSKHPRYQGGNLGKFKGNINGHFRNLNWRYLPYKAYFSGLNFREYPHKI
jgi:hypothetical protein